MYVDDINLIRSVRWSNNALLLSALWLLKDLKILLFINWEKTFDWINNLLMHLFCSKRANWHTSGLYFLVLSFPNFFHTTQ